LFALLALSLGPCRLLAPFGALFAAGGRLLLAPWLALRTLGSLFARLALG
jgi:hypothetical protein